jgi:alpha-1,3-rhamnosyl/mannosyltransferase
MTGIGNYCFHLLQALTTAYPELHYLGFRWSWSALDTEVLKAIGKRNDAHVTGPKANPGAARRAIWHLESLSRRRLTRSALARSIYRSRFAQTASSQSLDLFHAFNYLPAADPGTTTLPVVYDLSFVRFPEFHPRDRLKVLERLAPLLERSLRVQTISQFSKNEIAAHYGLDRRRIFVAPPAAAGIFRPLGLHATAPDLVKFDVVPDRYLISVGTLEPRKNLKTLVSAYARIPRAVRSRAPLLVVGGAGWGRLDLPREASRLVSEGSLRFLGTVTNAELRSLYEGAIALLYPSLYEGFGMPVVEAMACGTRVAHSAGTSMDEISNGLALRVEGADVDGWSAAITSMIAQADAGEHNLAELTTQAAKFDWGRTAAIVRQAYADLIEFK